MFLVQVRSEESGIRYFKTLEECLEAAKNDISIWKISFSLPTGERVRLTWLDGKWVYNPIILEK